MILVELDDIGGDRKFTEALLARAETGIKEARTELFMGVLIPSYFEYSSLSADVFGLYLLAKGARKLFHSTAAKRMYENDLRKINLR